MADRGHSDKEASSPRLRTGDRCKRPHASDSPVTTSTSTGPSVKVEGGGGFGGHQDDPAAVLKGRWLLHAPPVDE